MYSGSSPHTRGAPPGRLDVHVRERIIPAYAGSTGESVGDVGHKWDHPRIRGEHIDLRAAEDTTKGSSPHTRGALSSYPTCELPRRIIPAYAGSTRVWRIGCPRWRDHPRIRGEHCQRSRLAPPIWGSSPHTRGAPNYWDGQVKPVRIIPAYAGSTSGDGPDPHGSRDHPRIRGEHDLVGGGATLRRRIIPAYAGSTTPAS